MHLALNVEAFLNSHLMAVVHGTPPEAGPGGCVI